MQVGIKSCRSGPSLIPIIMELFVVSVSWLPSIWFTNEFKLNWLKVFCVIAGFVNLFGLNFTRNRTSSSCYYYAGAIIYLFTTIKNWKAFWLSIGSLLIGLSFSFPVIWEFGWNFRLLLWKNEFLSGMLGWPYLSKILFGAKGPLTYMHSYSSDKCSLSWTCSQSLYWIRF